MRFNEITDFNKTERPSRSTMRRKETALSECVCFHASLRAIDPFAIHPARLYERKHQMFRNKNLSGLWKFAGSLMIVALTALPFHGLHAEDAHNHDHAVEQSKDGNDAESVGVELSAEAMDLFGISLDKATSRVPSETAVAPARVSYNTEAMAHVGSPVAGRAGELKVRLGDSIEKGDVIAVIKSPELGTAESDLLQKRSLVEAAQSAVEVARIASQRADELRKANSLGVSELLSRQGELKKAESDLKVAEAAYLAAENHLHILDISQDQIERLLLSGEVTSQFEVRAPISGTIVQRKVTPGEVVGPDRETLFVIADMSTLWVLADVPGPLSHRLDKETPVRIKIDDAGDYEFAGVISYVSPELDPRTRTATVRIVLDANASTMDVEELPKSTVPAYDLSVDEIAAAKASGDWCAAHEAPESRCPLCGGDESRPVYSPAVIAIYEGRGDWCAEHRLPESRCTICNPSPGGDSAAEQPGPPAGLLLKPGMFGTVEFELTTAGKQSVLIREEAVQTMAGYPLVFIPSGKNLFIPREVSLGDAVGDWVPVLAGLREGDEYVVGGSFILKAELGKAGVVDPCSN